MLQTIMKKICLIFLILSSTICISQNYSTSNFIAKWKLVGEYNTNGEQIIAEIDNEYRK